MGDAEEEYAVHEELLCKRSVFFASAVKKEWTEGQRRHVPLPDDLPSVVDLYLQWVYGGRIFSRQAADEGVGDGKEFGLLIEGFIFGEKVQDGDFKDAVVDALINSFAVPEKKKGLRWCPIAPWVDRAYQGTPEASPLRKLLVTMYAVHGNRTWLPGTTSIDFLADLAGQLLEDRKAPYGPNTIKLHLSGCSYHHHGDGESCYRVKIFGKCGMKMCYGYQIAC